MRPGLLKTYSTFISLITRLADVLVVLLAGAVAFLVRFSPEGPGYLASHGVVPAAYGAVVVIGGLLTVVMFPAFGVYHSWRARGLLSPVARAVTAWGVVLLVLLALLVLAKQGSSVSRAWLSIWALLVAFSLICVRIVVFAQLRTLRRHGYNLRSAVIVGNGPVARNLLRRSHEPAWAGFDVVAMFDCGEGAATLDGDELRPLSGLPAFMAENQVDEVWVAVPLERGEKLRGILEALRCSTANVRYVPDLFGLFILNHGVSEILGNPMIDLSASPMQGLNRLIKGVEDRVLAVLILLLVWPLLALIALGVKLDSPGPVFFRQERLGWNGRPFQMLKFRSMPVDAEKNGVQWGNARNKQVTRFGAFLRRTSLDELPQFINVLKGDMSIVGPRPERPVFVEQFKNEIPGYMQKHMMKAGITGWAQVNGWRGDTDLGKRIEHDLYYIENWSLMFDLKIMFLTLFRGLMHKNAY